MYGNGSMLAKEFSCMLIWNVCSKYAKKRLLYQSKNFSFWGTKSPRPLPSFILLQQNLITPSHQIITNYFSWMWAIKPFRLSCQIIASNMHQNEWFQVWFFKNFLGRGSPSPLPRPLPPLFLGLRSRFGLRPQFSGASRPRLGLRPRYSGASRPRFRLRP